MVLLNLSGGHPKENYIEHFLFLCGPYFIIRCDIQYNIVTDCTIPTIYINPFQPLLVSGSFFSKELRVWSQLKPIISGRKHWMCFVIISTGVMLIRMISIYSC